MLCPALLKVLSISSASLSFFFFFCTPPHHHPPARSSLSRAREFQLSLLFMAQQHDALALPHVVELGPWQGKALMVGG